MSWIVVTPPAEEPVSVDEFKTHSHIDLDDEDTLIASYLQAAREMVEGWTRRALVTQTRRLYLPCWPEKWYLELPGAPLASVTSVIYTDYAGTATTWGTSNYHVDTAAEPGRVVRRYGVSWPSVTLQTVNPIAVTYVCGYGDAEDVPAFLQQAVRMLAAHWFEQREPVVVGSGMSAATLPLAVASLCQMFKVW